jgi:hypothetical protein
VRRIQLILAALAIVVTSFAAFSGPAVAQVVFQNDANFHNYGWCDNYDCYDFSYWEDDGCYWVWDDYWGWYYWC